MSYSLYSVDERSTSKEEGRKERTTEEEDITEEESVA